MKLSTSFSNDDDSMNMEFCLVLQYNFQVASIGECFSMIFDDGDGGEEKI
ncbi:hypothetical protein [Legionella gratiana]|nr:hypothetical protein [Legionella gratiana]